VRERESERERERERVSEREICLSPYVLVYIRLPIAIYKTIAVVVCCYFIN
jgi:hypothetical protein